MRYINLIGWWIRLMIARCKRYYDGPSHPSIDIVNGTPVYVPMLRQLKLFGGWEYAYNDHHASEAEVDEHIPPTGMETLFNPVAASPPFFSRVPRHGCRRYQLDLYEQPIPTDRIASHSKDTVQEVRERGVSPIGMRPLLEL